MRSIELKILDPRVGEEFALSEGENETLEGWRRDHQGWFERTCGFSPDMILVCERFRVIEDFGAAYEHTGGCSALHLAARQTNAIRPDNGVHSIRHRGDISFQHRPMQCLRNVEGRL